MREFRLLKADEIECRISETKEKYVRLLLYKTARTDAALLDEKFGIFGWRNEYKEIDGKMYCGIGIKSTEGEWVWKWNVGTESNTEAEKGQASDALKRAGFTWGLGAELYTAPDIQIWSPRVKIESYNGKPRCYEKFSVKQIEYDDAGKIMDLLIVSEKGKEVFKFRNGKEVKYSDGIDPKPIAEEKKITQEVIREPMATDEQKMKILTTSQNIDKLLAYYKIKSIQDMTMAQAEDALQILEKSKK